MGQLDRGRKVPTVRVASDRPRGRRAPAIATALALASGTVLAGWAILASRDNPPEDLAAIRSAIVARRFDEASAGLLRRLEREPGDDPARLMLGGLRMLEGRDEDARIAFEGIQTPGEARSRARNQIAEILIRRRLAAEAERALVDAIADDPSNADARRRLVYLLTMESRGVEARAGLRKLYRLTPDAHHLIAMTGLAVDEDAGRDRAGDLDEFLAKSPDDPLLRRARGLNRLRSGDAAGARADLEAAAKGAEDDPSTRSALADCLLELGDLAGVETALGAEPALADDRARWWVARGRLDEARNQPEPAINAYRKALEARPDDRKALYRLGQALARLGRVEEGRPLLARAEEVRLRDLTIVLEMDRCLRGGVDPGLFEKIAELCRTAGLNFEARAWFEPRTARADRSGTRQKVHRAESKPARRTINPNRQPREIRGRGRTLGPRVPL